MEKDKRLEAYFFAREGITIHAVSQEEALEKLAEITKRLEEKKGIVAVEAVDEEDKPKKKGKEE